MKIGSSKCLVIAMALALVCMPAWGQSLPNPTPVRNASDQGPNVDAFRAAYESAGEPTFLVLVSRNTEIASLGKFLEKTLLVDGKGSSPDAEALSRAVQEILLKNHNIDLVDLEALKLVAARDKVALEGQNERAVIDALKSRLNADFVLSIQLIQDKQVTNRHGRYRVTVDGTDLARGRRITTFSFDWMLDGDSVSIKRYASEITRKFIEQYAGAFKAQKRVYTVRVIGLADAGEMRTLRDELAKDSHVLRARDRAFNRVTTSSENRGRETNVGELRVTFSGSQLDLMDIISTVSETVLKREALATDTTDGAITFRLRALSSTVDADSHKDWDKDVERDLLAGRLIDAENIDPVSKRVRQSFINSYRNEGSPRIGVVLNRRIDDDNQNEAAAAVLPGDQLASNATPATSTIKININQSGNSGRQNSKTSSHGIRHADDANAANERSAQKLKELEFHTQLVEDGITQRLRKLGITTVDPDFIRSRILSKAAKPGEIFNESELEQLLRREAKEAGMDIVLLGHSSIQKQHQRHKTTGKNDSSLVQIGFTLRAINLANGEILGSVSFANVDVDASHLQDMIDKISDHIAGEISMQLWDVWIPPKVIMVNVYNAKTTRDVLAVMDTLKEKISGIQKMDFIKHEAGREEGVGIFNLRYSGEYNALLRQLNELGKDVSFDLDPRGITRAEINLRVRD